MSGTGIRPIEPTAPRFRVFISYASEDYQIADAIRACLSRALGDVFAEINIDKRFLQAGIDFKKQIESKLDITDVFIIAYTGTEKTSFGYTGWEVGYFDHVMKTTPGRLKVALYLEKPPDLTRGEQGIGIDVGRDKLQLTAEDFENQLSLSLTAEDPMCALISKWQQKVDDVTKTVGYGVLPRRPEQDPVDCVKAMKIDIYRYLKTTVDVTMKPQKQITIRATGAALRRSEGDLPGDALLIPVGSGGSMAIFGLSDMQPITWEQFLQSTDNSNYRDSWREAITTVIMSSFPDHINVDNSQIVVSSDESKAYRLILTTATKYYNDIREFNVYFVEALQRSDFGDVSTTLLLKGLELVCRFRFMFLEDASQFSWGNILVTEPERIPEVASRLLKELNLLTKDSRDAGLTDPTKWRTFVTWEDLLKMSQEYRPRELKIREIVGRIVQSKGQPDVIASLQKELAQTLHELQEKVRPLNTLLVRQMTRKLDELIPQSDGASNGTLPIAS